MKSKKDTYLKEVYNMNKTKFMSMLLRCDISNICDRCIENNCSGCPLKNKYLFNHFLENMSIELLSSNNIDDKIISIEEKARRV